MASNPNYPGIIPPPEGVIPDVDNNSSSRRSTLKGILIACTCIMTIFIAARAYVKLRVTRSWLWEDVTCAIGWALSMVFTINVLILTNFGVAIHAWDVSPQEYENFNRWVWINSLVFCPAAYFTKVTLLLLIARVFSVKRWVSRLIYIFIFVFFLAYLPIEIAKILVCSPIRAYWDPSVQGDCLNLGALFVADISMAIFVDLFILILPIPLVWSMTLSLKEKIKIASLLGVGGTAVGVTIWRLPAAISGLHDPDTTWSFTTLVLSAVLELTIGLVCSCFPALNILIARNFSKRLSPNSPRTRRKPAKGTLLEASGSTLVPPTDVTSTLPKTVSSSGKMQNSRRTYDTELTTLPEYGSQVPNIAEVEDEESLVLQRFDSLTSSLGRREGWLSSGAEGSNSTSNCAVDVTLELGRVSGNREWNAIFVGQDNVEEPESPPPAALGLFKSHQRTPSQSEKELGPYGW